jgi:hypothetical protein
MPVKNTAVEDDGDELDFELITNAKQMLPPKPPRKEPVVLTELGKNARDRYQGYLMWELTQGEFNDYQRSNKVLDNNGYEQGVDFSHSEIKLLSFCARDANGNRIWSTPEKAVEQLKKYGRATIEKMLAAANKANSISVASAEGNSEETESGSSSSS